MARDKYRFTAPDGSKWSTPIGEDGKPLESSVAKKFGIIPKKATKK